MKKSLIGKAAKMLINGTVTYKTSYFADLYE